MSIINFVYNDQVIDFEPMGKDDIMVNATQMAKIFAKRVDSFLRLEQTKEFINVMELTHFRVNSDNELTQICVSSPVLTRDKIVRGENGNATFFHRILALKFAAWLDPKFELWIIVTIDKILNQTYRDQRNRKVQSKSLSHSIKQRKSAYILNPNADPIAKLIFEDEILLREIDSSIRSENRKENRNIQYSLSLN